MDVFYDYGLQHKWTQAQYKTALFKIMSDERVLLNSGIRALNSNRRSWSIPLPKQD